jgi:hypothetical protein
VIEDGRVKGNSNCPLIWSFNDVEYYGAAHGSCGILYHIIDIILTKKIQFDKEEEVEILLDIQKTINYLISLFLLKGNLPTDSDLNFPADQVYRKLIEKQRKIIDR